MKLTKHVYTRICLLHARTFRSCDHDPTQYTRLCIGFKRLNSDHDTCTDYWSSSKVSFCHCIWGKFSNVAKKVTNLQNMGSADSLWPCLQKYTAILAFLQTTGELSMKSCESQGISHNNWTSTWVILCFGVLQLLFLGIALDLPTVF